MTKNLDTLFVFGEVEVVYGYIMMMFAALCDLTLKRPGEYLNFHPWFMRNVSII